MGKLGQAFRSFSTRVVEGLLGRPQYAPSYNVCHEAELYGRIADLEQRLHEAWGDEVDPYEYLTDTPGFARTGLRWVHNETELAEIRAVARLLTTCDPMSVGIAEKLTNYVIRTGFTYTAAEEKGVNAPTGLKEAVQKIVDEFRDLNDWDNDLDREIFRTAHEDGDEPLALYADEYGQTVVRAIDADQIVTPKGEAPEGRDWSFGVDTASRDVQRVHGYWIDWGNGVPEWMAAEQIEHIKLNVRRNRKRGLSDWYPVHKKLADLAKLDRNTTKGAAVQAAIAYIRELPSNTTPAGASSIQSLNATQQQTRQYPIGERTVTTQKFEPGSILTVVGSKYTHGPMGQSNAPSYISVLQNGWRIVSARWSMPEHVATSDASNNNFASILEAGTPFVLYCEQQQQFFAARFLRIIWKALKNAYMAGRFAAFHVTWSDILRLIDIQVIPPDVASRDPKAETERRSMLRRDGVISLKRYRQEEGYDPDEMAKEVAEEPAPEPSSPSTFPAATAPESVNPTTEGFDPSQPRDKYGRFASAGGIGAMKLRADYGSAKSDTAKAAIKQQAKTEASGFLKDAGMPPSDAAADLMGSAMLGADMAQPEQVAQIAAVLHSQGLDPQMAVYAAASKYGGGVEAVKAAAKGGDQQAAAIAQKLGVVKGSAKPAKAADASPKTPSAPPATPTASKKPAPTPKTPATPKASQQPAAGFAGPKDVRKFDAKLESSPDLKAGVSRMDDASKATIQSYTSGETDYRKMNDQLRQGKMPKEAAAINQAIDQAGALPEGTTVYRGLSLSAEERSQMVDQFKAASASGGTITMSGISSTSIDPTVATSFADRGDSAGVIFEMKPKSGAYVSELSGFDAMARKNGGRAENEVLLQHGKKYRVVGVQEDVSLGKKKPKGRGHTVVQLEEVA